MAKVCLDPEGKIDYTKAFITFCHRDYLQIKLEMHPHQNKQVYLTELLRTWAYLIVCESPERSVRVDNPLLLLRFGADANALFGQAPGVFDMTIWFPLLVMMFTVYEDCPNMRGLLQEFLQWGADVNSSITCYSKHHATRGETNYDPGQSLSEPFLLCKWSVLDVVSGGNSSAFQANTLQHAGALSARKELLWYQPPDKWRVSKPGTHGHQTSRKYGPRHSLGIDFTYFTYRVGYAVYEKEDPFDGLERTLEQNLDDF